MRMILVSNVEYQVYDGQIKLCIDLDKKNYFCGEWKMIEYHKGMWYLVWSKK